MVTQDSSKVLSSVRIRLAARSLAVVQGTERKTSNFDAASSNLASETKPDMFQGGAGDCKSSAIAWLVRLPSWVLHKNYDTIKVKELPRSY